MAVSVEAAAIKKAYWEDYFKNITVDDLKNDTIKREVVSLKILGDSVLESDKLQTVRSMNPTEKFFFGQFLKFNTNFSRWEYGLLCIIS